jgi:hypothetical protein
VTRPTPETVEDQASTVRTLLHYLHLPLGPKHYVRGILPAPEGRPALRLATGRRKAGPPDFRLYEIPLDRAGEPVTPHHMLALLRAAHRGTHLYSSSRVEETMGMTVIHLDPSQDPTAKEPAAHRRLSLLTSLTCPATDDLPFLPLVGFLPTAPGTVRLYLAPPSAPGIVAADVRLSGPLTAIEAVLPSVLQEKERRRKDKGDPHCWRRVDLRDW